MFTYLLSVILAVTAPALQAKPYTYYAIAEAQEPYLRAEGIPMMPEGYSLPPSIIASEEFKGENTAYHDFDTQSSPEATGGLKNDNLTLIKGLIKQYFPDEPLMLKIADCESSLIHYENGKVLRGRTTPDFGLFQINELWLPKAEAMGIDIYDLEGNIKMAKFIYDTQGLSAWSASFKNCWKNI